MTIIYNSDKRELARTFDTSAIDEPRFTAVAIADSTGNTVYYELNNIWWTCEPGDGVPQQIAHPPFPTFDELLTKADAAISKIGTGTLFKKKKMVREGPRSYWVDE